MNFAIVLLVHLMYDFHWQGNFIGEWKSKSWFVLFIHCLTYALSIGVVMHFLGILQWWTISTLLLSHYIIDDWKCKLPPEKLNVQALYVDQAWHLLFLIFIMIKF